MKAKCYAVVNSRYGRSIQFRADRDEAVAVALDALRSTPLSDVKKFRGTPFIEVCEVRLEARTANELVAKAATIGRAARAEGPYYGLNFESSEAQDEVEAAWEARAEGKRKESGR